MWIWGPTMTASEKTALALRVLTAVNDREKPADVDVLLLHLHLPRHQELDPEELACPMILGPSDTERQ